MKNGEETDRLLLLYTLNQSLRVVVKRERGDLVWVVGATERASDKRDPGPFPSLPPPLAVYLAPLFFALFSLLLCFFSIFPKTAVFNVFLDLTLTLARCITRTPGSSGIGMAGFGIPGLKRCIQLSNKLVACGVGVGVG